MTQHHFNSFAEVLVIALRKRDFCGMLLFIKWIESAMRAWHGRDGSVPRAAGRAALISPARLAPRCNHARVARLCGEGLIVLTR